MGGDHCACARAQNYDSRGALLWLCESPVLSIGSHPGLLRTVTGKRLVGSATELLLRQRPAGLEHSELFRSMV